VGDAVSRGVEWSALRSGKTLRIRRSIILENRMRGLTAIDRWARHELAEAWPPFLFFLSGFLMLLLIVKLTLATLDVRLTALSKAIVGALLAAKAVLIIDATPLARHLEQYRRIFVVAIKTLIYGSVTLMLGYIERILEARHKAHNLHAALQDVAAQVSMFRLLAWALGVSLIFALYFAFFEISERMGKGRLWALFFESKAGG
jgi:hypothetical protein